MTRNLLTKHIYLKSRITMSCRRCVESVGIRILGVRCSRWHSRQTNDAVASERSIFSENKDYKSVDRVAVNPYIPIFLGLDACSGRKLRTHTRDNYCNPRCAHAHRGLMKD